VSLAIRMWPRLRGWWRRLVTVAGMVQRLNESNYERSVARHEFRSVMRAEIKERQRVEQQLRELADLVDELLPAPSPPPLVPRSNLEASQLRARELLTKLDAA
jgi:hypothetical protein